MRSLLLLLNIICDRVVILINCSIKTVNTLNNTELKMKFVGIDFGWLSGASGLCCLVWQDNWSEICEDAYFQQDRKGT